MADPGFDDLKAEVKQLFASMQMFRLELAAARPADAAEDRFETMAEQLAAIVQATEDATNTILLSAEGISDLIAAHREAVAKSGDAAWLGELDDKINAMFEACAFQDITGQRITKILGALKFIEERINAMADLWGRKGLSEAQARADKDDRPVGERLEGPALKGEGASQEDIDKLFD